MKVRESDHILPLCIKPRDVSGGPVGKNLPSNVGDSGWMLGQELGAHVPEGN